MADIGTAYVRIAPNMTGIQGKISSGLKGSGSKFAEQFGGEISGKSAVIIGALAGIAQAATTKAMSLVTNSISSAISRVDTLNAAGKTFEYMGFAAADSAKATSNLTKSIQGMPTPLDSAMRGMTALAATYQDVQLGQKAFTALNNAILGFGGSAAMVDNAIQQISQLPLDGPLDAQTWNSLRNSGLTPVLVAMSKDFGMSVADMKKAFGEGELSVQDFINKLTEMDVKGGGGLESLQKIALNATGGIGTGFQNMQTAVTRGLANIIQAIGAANISAAIGTIGKAFETVLNYIANTIPKVINGIKSFFQFVERNKDIIYPIAVAIGAVVAAITAWRVANIAWTAATKAASAAQAAFNAVLAINPITAITLAIVGLVAGLTYFFTQTQTGQKIFANFTKFLSGVWASINSGIQSVSSFFSSVWSKIQVAIDAVSNAFTAVTSAVSSFVSSGIGALNTALQASIKWLYDWRTWFINIGIVIGTIVLPKLIQLGIQAAKTAAQWVAAMAKMVASTVKAAAQSVAAFARMAASATVNAAKTAAAWVASAARTAAVWVTQTLPRMIGGFVAMAAQAVLNAVKTSVAWVLSAGQVLLAWTTTFAGYIAQLAIASAQTVMAGARMAAAWLMAMGPIGIIVAAVAGAVALIIANWDSLTGFFQGLWDGIVGIISTVIGWIKQNWPMVLAIITGPIGLAVLAISKNWESIKNGASSMINSLVSFFKGLPGKITGAIGNMGSLLYNSGKDLINGLLNGAGSLLKNIGKFFLDIIPGWIRTPFKKALGINSPSREFMGYGENITEGLVMGVEDDAASVRSAVSTLADNAMQGIGDSSLGNDINATVAGTASNSRSALAQPGGNTTTNDVRIGTVVLGDQSAVREWFKQLNSDILDTNMGITPNQGMQTGGAI